MFNLEFHLDHRWHLSVCCKCGDANITMKYNSCNTPHSDWTVQSGAWGIPFNSGFDEMSEALPSRGGFFFPFLSVLWRSFIYENKSLQSDTAQVHSVWKQLAKKKKKRWINQMSCIWVGPQYCKSPVWCQGKLRQGCWCSSCRTQVQCVQKTSGINTRFFFVVMQLCGNVFWLLIFSRLTFNLFL